MYSVLQSRQLIAGRVSSDSTDPIRDAILQLIAEKLAIFIINGDCGVELETTTVLFSLCLLIPQAQTCQLWKTC